MLSPRAIAVRGYGYSPRLIAVRGYWPTDGVEPETPPPSGGSGLQTRRRRLGKQLHWLTPFSQTELLDEIVAQREAEIEELVEAKAHKLRRKPIVVAISTQPELRQSLQPTTRPAQVWRPEGTLEAYKAAERSLTAALAQVEKRIEEQKAAALLEESDMAFVMAMLAMSDE
jgi:hypothetical protein